MIIPVTVLEWRTNGRRVHDRVSGDSYLLNSNRMFDIKEHTDGSCMTYIEDIHDVKDSGAYLVCTSTPAQIIAMADEPADSLLLTVNIFPRGDTSKTAQSTDILIENFSYAKGYRDGTYSHIVYSDGSGRQISGICEETLTEITDMIAETPDGAPTLLVATVVSNTEIDLTWVDNSTNEEGFEVAMSEDGGVTYDTSYFYATDSVGSSQIGLTPGTEYYYKVRAFNGSNYSEWSNVVSATTLLFYYVSNSGEDTNSGLYEDQAWQTLAYAEANATTPGCIIALKRGDTWSITGLQINHGGSDGVYITWDGDKWGEGAKAIILATTDVGGGIDYGLVHISGCSNVIFKNITVDVDNHGLYGVVVGGDIESFGGIPQSNESNIIIQSCSILDCYKAATYACALLVQNWNTDMSNISVISCLVDGASNAGITFYPGRIPNGATLHQQTNMYIGYNVITNCGKLNNGVGSSIVVTGKNINPIVEYNTVTSGASGHAYAITVDGDNTSGEPYDYYPTAVICRYNDLNDTSGNRSTVYLENSGPTSAYFYYNKIYNSTKDGVYIATATTPDWTGASLYFYNNTIVVDGGGQSFVDQTNITGAVTLKNNIFINLGTEGNYADFAFIGQTGYLPIHNNNLYYKTQNQSYKIILTNTPDTYYTPAQITDFEATGLAVDPTLTNIAGFDWTLQAGSPCINAGVDVGLTEDYEGNPIVGLPDIGAYEKQ